MVWCTCRSVRERPSYGCCVGKLAGLHYPSSSARRVRLETPPPPVPRVVIERRPHSHLTLFSHFISGGITPSFKFQPVRLVGYNTDFGLFVLICDVSGPTTIIATNFLAYVFGSACSLGLPTFTETVIFGPASVYFIHRDVLPIFTFRVMSVNGNR